MKTRVMLVILNLALIAALVVAVFIVSESLTAFSEVVSTMMTLMSGGE